MAATMNFFRAQDEARGRTTWLVVLLVCAVITLIGSLYVVAVLGHARLSHHSPVWWQPELFFITSGVAGVVVLGGSLLRIIELSQGGSAVAERMGCRLVLGSTGDPLERRYVNVVQEMALASGLPVPLCYVIDHDETINAFAAGNTPQDAAVGVTRGALERLNREELQGVIAHEFSHIGNGDMRLNLRIIGAIAGLLALANLGYILIRLGANSGGDRKKSNGLIFIAAGAVVVVVGLGGMLFARIIQAAVSRQREYLADASAVQFTRNPRGLASALAKVGQAANAPREESAARDSVETQHLFFSSTPGILNQLFSTHPPLVDRIQRIDPQFSGTTAYQCPADGARVATEQGGVSGLVGAPIPSPVTPRTPVAASLAQIAAVAAEPTNLEIQEAVSFHGRIPAVLRDAADEPVGAMALVLGLTLSTDAATRGRQLAAAAGIASGEVVRQVGQVEPVLRDLPAGSRVAVLDLAMPSLRQLSPAQRAQFGSIVRQAGASLNDGLLVLLLDASMRRYLDQPPPMVSAAEAAASAASHMALVLSAVVQTSSESPERRRQAYERGMASLKLRQGVPPYVEDAGADLARVQRALDGLLALAVGDRRAFVRACGLAMLNDSIAEPKEVEMVRAVADSLGISFSTGVVR